VNGTQHKRQVHVNGMICWAICEWHGVGIGVHKCVASPVNDGEFEPFVCDQYEVTAKDIQRIDGLNELKASLK